MPTKTKKYKETEKLLKDYNLMKSMIIEDEILLKQHYDLKALSYNSVSISKSNNHFSEVESMVEKKLEVEKRITKNRMIIAVIDMGLRILDEVSREIITGYYIDNHGWIRISMTMHLTERQCQRLRTKAIETMYQVIYIDDKKLWGE